MIKDITIGQYFAGSSFLHNMDARVKIILTFALIVLIFLCKSLPALGLMVLITLGLVLLSRVPMKMVLKSIRPLAVIVVFTAILNVFYIKGGTELFAWHFLHITTKGLFTALFMTVRILCLVVISSLLTYTTTPTTLTDAIESLLSPLKVFKVPVHTLTMMMTLALRFIPVLIDEIDRITSAQKARGADFETGGLMQKAKALIPIIVPLFVSSVKHAYELADAMDCRCYTDGSGRTRMKQMHVRASDFAACGAAAAMLAGLIVCNHFFTAVI